MVSIARITGSDWLVRYKHRAFNRQIYFVDHSFFKQFDFKLLKGDANTALSHPQSVVLNESTAAEYFGDEDPIGKQMSIRLGDRSEDWGDYLVTGIIADQPQKTAKKS